MELKTCNKCGVKKEETKFSIASGGNYRRTTCRVCETSIRKVRDELRAVTPPTPKDHKCPVCLRNEQELAGCGGKKSSPWVLDHDHLTGRFRGWLCHNCNRMLGALKDDFDTMDRIREYLKIGREG
jgi:hypothetical protein